MKTQFHNTIETQVSDWLHRLAGGLICPIARRLLPLCGLVWIGLLPGCSLWRQEVPIDNSGIDEFVNDTIERVNYEESIDEGMVTASSLPPFSLNDDSAQVIYWDLKLHEVIETALGNSAVLRDLGARVLRSPSATPTVYDASIVTTDPRFGVEGALSAFDADVSTQLFYEKNDRALNNALLGGGTNFFEQDLWRFQTELRKRAANGATFSLRHYVEDDLNNAPQNLFGTDGLFQAHAWSWNVEAEARQPLLQGGGVAFNRIAGPDATPGAINGVVLAQVNSDQSVSEFEIAIRDYLSNVENAYWDLVYAYRDLNAKKKARDRSLETWQRIKIQAKQEIQGATDDRVAQAAEQYFRFQEEVETALSGRLTVGTRDSNGTTGGTFQANPGVYVAERRLRLVMGLPINDGRLIRPTTEPIPSEVILDWDQVLQTALSCRPEVRLQKLRVKRRSLELQASRNFLMPALDLVGRYRRRGLGDSLYSSSVPDPNNPMGPFVGSDTDEWQLGVELSAPIGFRQAHAGVRNAELMLAREKALLIEVERQVVHDVSNAVSEQARIFRSVKNGHDRLQEAEKQFTVLADEKRSDAEEVDIGVLLDAERRLAEAEIAHQRALVGYAVALKNLHLESGDLMSHCNVQFAGSPAKNGQ